MPHRAVRATVSASFSYPPYPIDIYTAFGVPQISFPSPPNLFLRAFIEFIYTCKVCAYFAKKQYLPFNGRIALKKLEKLPHGFDQRNLVNCN